MQTRSSLARYRKWAVLTGVLIAALLLTRSLTEAPPPTRQAGLTIDKPLRGEVDVSGYDGSPMHEDLVALADWLETGAIRENASGISIRGVATTSGGWDQAFEAFSSRRGRTADIESHVEIVDETISADALFARMFRVIASEPQIRFKESGVELSAASFAALDRVIEFARDCPSFGIMIEGHSDGTGHEPANLALSQRRAEVVAGYIANGGIERSRLQPVGKGSSEPIGDDATMLGRQLNRRIEFLLKPLP